jgi:uncharacterized membrane protein
VTSTRWSAVGLMAVAIVCAVLNAISPLWAIQIATAAPLVLFLPGAALVLAVDPSHRRTRTSERPFWALLASIGVAIAGGLVLNVVSALTRPTWLSYLLGVVLLAASLSTLRRTDGRVELGPVNGTLWSRLRTTRFSLLTTLLSIGTLVLVAGALALSVYSSATSNREQFVQLWILPIPAGAGSTAARAEVGLTNYEGRRDSFVVVIAAPGSSLHTRQTVVLRAGHTWTSHIRRRHLAPVLVIVSLASQPSRILDSVTLASPVR